MALPEWMQDPSERSPEPPPRRPPSSPSRQQLPPDSQPTWEELLDLAESMDPEYRSVQTFLEFLRVNNLSKSSRLDLNSLPPQVRKSLEQYVDSLVDL